MLIAKRLFTQSAVAVLAPLAFLLALGNATRGSGPWDTARAVDVPAALPPLALPRVTFIPPSGASFTGTTSTNSQVLQVHVCSDAIVSPNSTRTITWNGVNAVSSFSGALPDDPDSACETEVVFTGTVTLSTGTNTLTFAITDAQGTTSTSATYTYTNTGGSGGTAAVTVTPDGGAQSVADSLPTAVSFAVTNTGSAAATFDLSAVCTGAGASTCTTSRPSVTLQAGEVAAVAVAFRAGAAGASAGVMLKAWKADAATVRDSGNVAVSVTNEPAAGHVDQVALETAAFRGLCVAAAIGAGAAYECGDLRLAHSLPATRILSKSAAPTLLYNSRSARWLEIVGAMVTAPATTPDSVKAVVTLGGVTRASGAWAGWAGGTARWISLGFDANTLGTGVHPYTVTVTTKKAGVESALTTLSGQFIQVNRSNSPYGRGWWVAGVEQIVPLTGGQLLWIGGDGSATVYAPTGTTGRWVGAALTEPDTLKADTAAANAGGWVRELSGGARVIFNAAGEHRWTRNVLGHYTEFVYSGGKLTKILLPRGTAFDTGYEYLFEYGTNGKLNRVVAPYAALPGDRNVGITTDASGHITAIMDPDSSQVTFTPHASIAGVIVRRTDPRGIPTDYTFGGFLRLSKVEVDRDSTPGITTTISPQEMLGRPGTPAVPASDLKTAIDGPRTDVVDITTFHLDRFAAPDVVTDAAGGTTRVIRGDSRFPALVTYERDPLGAESSASFDARGNLVTSVDWSTVAAAGRAAVSLYEWDPVWDELVKSTMPGGEVQLTGLDAMGRVSWVQRGIDAARRTTVTYVPTTSSSAPGLVATVTHPAVGGQPAAMEQVEYDIRGNTSAQVSPMGFRTETTSDRIGRTVETRTPIDSLQTFIVRDSVLYDRADRVVRTVRRAPAVGPVPMQRLVVETTYDAGDNVLAVARRSEPDTAHVGTSTTRWGYDRLGRSVVEIAPDSARDSTFYDVAGNVVRIRSRRFAETGADVTMEYDLLNRLVRRVTPGVVYADTTANGWTFPRFPNCQTTRHCIPADTATFTYDLSGNLLTADNRDARIRRTYDASGRLATDSLRIRTWAELGAGGDFTQHVYGLRFRYDLSGRRVALLYPHQLGARRASVPNTVYDSVAYGYDSVTGAMNRVRDVFGNEFGYAFDVQGRVDRVLYPLGHYKQLTYDPDGRVRSIRQDRTSTGAAGNEILLRYDAGGRIRYARPFGASSPVTKTYYYSGMGALYEADETFPNTEIDAGYSWWTPDAFGNVAAESQSRTSTALYPTATTTNASSFQNNTYQLGTVRLLSAVGGSSVDVQTSPSSCTQNSRTRSTRTLRYDRAGNQVWTDRMVTDTTINYCAPGVPIVSTTRVATRSYYDLAGRLRTQEKRYVRVSSTSSQPEPEYYEEFRYDALGRRILRRNRLGVINRFVWDQDRVIAETQYPGGSAMTAAELERDTASLPNGSATAGRVLYTHGADLDAPLAIVRIGYGSETGGVFRALDPFVMAPDWDWRGQGYGQAFYGPTTLRRCGGSSDTACVWISWPATGAYHTAYGPGIEEVRDWFGSLANDQRTAGGQLYRRNRYYDPQTGRFTQEDPIGLAGGLNLYGFAGGDPVNFTDPYGLAPGAEDDPDGVLQQGIQRPYRRVTPSTSIRGPRLRGGIESHEGRFNPASRGQPGHTLSRHVLTLPQLRERYRRDRMHVSAFPDRGTANRVIAEALRRDSYWTRDWLQRSPTNVYVVTQQFRYQIGTHIDTYGRERPAYWVQIFLRRGANPERYYVETVKLWSSDPRARGGR